MWVTMSGTLSGTPTCSELRPSLLSLVKVLGIATTDLSLHKAVIGKSNSELITSAMLLKCI